MPEHDLAALTGLAELTGPPPALADLERRSRARRSRRRIVTGSAMILLLVVGVATSAAVRRGPGAAVADQRPLPDPVPAGWVLQLDERTTAVPLGGRRIEVLSASAADPPVPPFVAVTTYPPSQEYGIPVVGATTTEAGDREITLWSHGSTTSAAWLDADGSTRVVTGIDVARETVVAVAGGDTAGLRRVLAGDLQIGDGEERVYVRDGGTLSIRTTAGDLVLLIDLVVDRASGGTAQPVEVAGHAAVAVSQGPDGETTSVLWLDSRGVREVVGNDVPRQLVLDVAAAVAR